MFWQINLPFPMTISIPFLNALVNYRTTTYVLDCLIVIGICHLYAAYPHTRSRTNAHAALKHRMFAINVSEAGLLDRAKERAKVDNPIPWRSRMDRPTMVPRSGFSRGSIWSSHKPILRRQTWTLCFLWIIFIIFTNTTVGSTKMGTMVRWMAITDATVKLMTLQNEPIQRLLHWLLICYHRFNGWLRGGGSMHAAPSIGAQYLPELMYNTKLWISLFERFLTFWYLACS